jgi:GNAT superfamily N-acetyltransferase
MVEVTVRPAHFDDLDALAQLFDGYRRFYGKPADVDGARAFLGERMAKGDSVIFLAERAGKAAGFTQLYPSFSSVGMARTYILNDLFVAPEHRAAGAAEALLAAAQDYAKDGGAIRLTLSTQFENRPAQALYEKHGWARDDKFCVYNLKLTD